MEESRYKHLSATIYVYKYIFATDKSAADRCNTDASENERNIQMEIDKDNVNLAHTALVCTSDTIIESD